MIGSTELIERWSQGKRVLVSMSDHERQHHWNMNTWGRQTECGTVACAAGQCGLDPWFRDRGFRLDFNGMGTDATISDVSGFFGLEGTARIFWNSKQRSVETVIDEMDTYIAELQRIAELSADYNLPRVGEDWPEQGGVFAGVRIGPEGVPDYFLIVGPEHAERINWPNASQWAAELSVSGRQDFSLPLRSEGHALFDRVRSLFRRESYWLGEQHAANAGCAWGQGFLNGGQNDWSKDNKLWARAVRRVPL